MDFVNAYAHGFVRLAARVLPIHLGEPAKNAQALIADIRDMHDQGVALVAYPELCVTGYSCEDLFLQQTLLDAAEEAIASIADASSDLRPYIVVGAPIRFQNRLYNCAIVIQGGEILGVVPKSYLPNYREFYERRWFAPGDDVSGVIEVGGHLTVIDPNSIWGIEGIEGFGFHVEVCEDMWVPLSPSAQAALAGATVLVNISGSPITIGKADERKLLAQSTSTRCHAAYLFTAAGPGESSTDLSWDGQTFIYEAGDLLGESERFPTAPSGTITDIDIRGLMSLRYRKGSFDDNRRTHGTEVRFDIDRRVLDLPVGDIGLRRKLDRFPFVPDDPSRLAQDCYEAYNIQVYGLVQRMKAIGSPKLVIGVSGGLDSTHALIVCAKAMDLLGRPRSDILAFTMPGFATLEKTKSQALALMEAMGATFETIDIRPAATQMLTDMGHGFALGEELYDVTFENVQAGLRTDYLFRLANQRGGIVVGTGDLSELALGWCTYGVGDQMSHYAVNTGVPKTLIQYLIRWVISEGLFDQATNGVLESILAQEISPELIPAKDGQTMQSTEAIIGPYSLNDFFLFHFLRGDSPSRIAFLAWNAWRDSHIGLWPTSWADNRKVEYSLESIGSWLELFLKRFFSSQFKRSAIPNGPKVSAGGTLSPRGDWRMPSDVSAATWLHELEENLPS